MLTHVIFIGLQEEDIRIAFQKKGSFMNLNKPTISIRIGDYETVRMSWRMGVKKGTQIFSGLKIFWFRNCEHKF